MNIIYEAEKVSAVIEEVEASFNLIITGLKNLKEQKSGTLNNHVTLQLLASGIERLLKILILLKDKHLTGSFPELKKARTRFKDYDNGHGIEKMLNELLIYSDSSKLMLKIPMVVEDMEYLKQDKDFRTFIRIITDFSIQQRYYYIDTIVLENQNNSINPFKEFKRLIYSFSDNVDVSKLTYNEEEELLINNTIVCIEKGVRAISRFFTHGLGDLGRQYYNNFSSFILLNDKELGSLKYTERKKLASENYKPLQELSVQFLKILLLSKSKTLYSKQFTNWAFTIDLLKVYSYNGTYFFAKINGNVFALTGATSTRYKIPTYFASDKLKPRQYALYLLDEAKKI